MRELRDKNPENYRLITIRTVEGRLWLTPGKRIRKLIGGILARYQESLGIELYAYCVLGNHMHLVIRSPKENTDEFCENVNREIARRINWIHRREGPLWSRRYVDQKIVIHDDLLEAFLYVATNPTRHGLVKNSSSWPGLNCINHLLTEKDRVFSFHLYGTQEIVTHSLKLSILPHFLKFSKNKRVAEIKRLLLERTEAITTERKENGEEFLGLEKLQLSEPGEKPLKISKAPRVPFYSKCRDAIKETREKIKATREAYTYASIKYRLGDLSIKFPEYTFFPPLHRKPRLFPLQPLSTVNAF